MVVGGSPLLLSPTGQPQSAGASRPENSAPPVAEGRSGAFEKEEALRAAEIRSILKSSSSVRRSTKFQLRKESEAIGRLSLRGLSNASHISFEEEAYEPFLMDVFLDLYSTDPGTKTRALEAFREEVEEVASDQDVFVKRRRGGVVDRRAPLDILGRKSVDIRTDPALKNTPLRGRLVALLTTSAALMFVFLQALCLNAVNEGYAHAPFNENSMVGPSGKTLVSLGGLNTNEIRNYGQVFRIFWAAWMHSGWIHIGINVISQIQFFFMFEPDWGFWRCFLLFWISGVTGNLVSAVADPCTTTVGSSGGLFGLMGGMIPYCFEYWETIPRPCCMLVFVLIVLLLSIIVGFSGNTDNWAHSGGLFAGILFGLATISSLKVLPRRRRKPDGENEKPQQLTQPPQKQIRTVAVDRALKKAQIQCTWRFSEITVRGFSILALLGIWIATWILLLDNFEFQPVGHVGFKGVTHCVCCYAESELYPSTILKGGTPWTCFGANEIRTKDGQTWKQVCKK